MDSAKEKEKEKAKAKAKGGQDAPVALSEVAPRRESQNSFRNSVAKNAGDSALDASERLLHEQQPPWEEQAEDESGSGAPDGGYAWWVLVGSFVCNLLVDGVVFAFGGIYEHLKVHFHASATDASLVGSLLCGFYLLMGPFTSVLCRRFGCRNITMTGSVVACVSFIVSMFASSIHFLQVSLGVLGGIGFGLIYLPSIVIVGYWFDKKRAMATGIAVCGSSLGGFALAPLCQILLAEYDWRGTTLILGGFVLNAAWGGALYRSVEEHQRMQESKRRREEKEEKEKLKTSSKMNKTKGGDKSNSRKSKIMNSVIREKQRQRTESTHSLDNCVITGDNQILKMNQSAPHPDSELHQSTIDNSKTIPAITNLTVSDGQLHKIAEDVIRKQKGDSVSVSVRKAAPMRQSSKSVAEEAPTSGTNANSETATNRHNSQSMHNSRHNSDASKAMKEEFNRYRVTSDANRMLPDDGRRRRDLSRSFVGSIAAFPVGSVNSLANRRATISHAQRVPQNESLSEKFSRLMNKAMQALQETFDVSLMKSPTMILIIFSSVMSMLGFFLPFMFITGMARSIGLPPNEATVMLMTMNIANAFGRVTSGWMSDRSCVDVLWTNNIALILAGGATICSPLCTTYTLLLVYSIFFGFCIAAFVTLRSILLVEVLGLDKLTNAFGWLILFQGFSVIFGPPVGGMFFDATQSYTTTFMFGGIVLTCSGIVLMPLRKLSEWEKAKKAKKNAAV